MNYLHRCFVTVAAVSLTASLAVAQGWTPTGGQLRSDASAVRRPDGRLQVFGIGMDYRIWSQVQAATATGWSGWDELDPHHQWEARFTGNPVAIVNSDGRLEVFARDMDARNVWHIWQWGDGSWSRWESLGGEITDDIAVGINDNGRVEVFGRWWDGELRHIYQRFPHHSWSGWEGMGIRMLGRPAVGRHTDLRLEVFFLGTDSSLLSKWQVTRGGSWAGPAQLRGGKLTSNPVVTTNLNGGLEVFGRGMYGDVQNVSQPRGGGPWAPSWASLGGYIPVNAGISAGRNRLGGLEVFVRGADNALWVNRQVSPPSWTGFRSINGVGQGAAAVGVHPSGLLELFARRADGYLERIRQSDSTSW